MTNNKSHLLLEDGDPLHLIALAIKDEAANNNGIITDEVLISVEKNVRNQFGGGKCYIAKKQSTSTRNELINIAPIQIGQ